MNKKHLYIILLSFISLSSQAQRQAQHRLDSMLADLGSEKYRNNDTNRAKQLVRVSWGYSDLNNNGECLNYLEQALALSKKLNFNRGIQKAYETLGEIYMATCKNEKALKYYDSAMQVATEMVDKEAIVMATGNRALVYYQMGDYKKSLEINLDALKIAEESQNKEDMAFLFNSIGNCYLEQGYFPGSMEYFEKALNIFEQLGQKKRLAVTHVNIANVLLHEGDYPNGLKHFDQALNIYRELENTVGIAYTYAAIGSAYQLQDDLDKSLEYFQKALKILDKINDKNLAARLTANTGITYYKQRQFIKAIEYFQASLNVLSETGDQSGVALSLNMRASCFLDLIHSGQENIAGPAPVTIEPELSRYLGNLNIPVGKPALMRAAFEGYRKGLAISRQINAQSVTQNSYEGLAEAYKMSNDYKKALLYSDSALAIKDTLFSKDKNDKIIRLELKSEFDQQHLKDSLSHIQDIQAESFKLREQKLLLYVSAGIFLLVIAAMITFQRGRAARNKAQQQAIFSRQLLDTELKALRAQMNPHFIFNSLNSIQAFILKENKAEATDYLQKFSKLMRMILDNSQKTTNTIEEEVEILTLYIDLERLRLKNKFDFEIKISGDLDPTFVEIPSLVIQPLVENSIWHGLMNAPGKGLLRVEFIKDKNKLVCMVEDNGVGRERAKEMKADNIKSHESKGLKLIEARLQAWSKAKGLKYTFVMADHPEPEAGTRTEITILYPPYA